MKKKIVWLLSCLMVAALLLAACAPAEVEEEEVVKPEEEEVVKPEEEEVVTEEKEMVRDSLGRLVEKPKYGGTLTFVSIDVLGFDEAGTLPYTEMTLPLTHDELLVGDWARGPAGSGEVSWASRAFLAKFMVGSLAESYEIPDSQTLIFHIREGVHFALYPPSPASKLLNGREVTAADVVFTLERLFRGGTYHVSVATGSFMPESITAPDKWTVVIKVPKDAGMALPYITDMAHIVAREVVEEYGDLYDWETSCGTGSGPFILTDYVADSSITFIRNTNHWRKDPLHPQNSLPYVDKVKWLIIPDASTVVSALRTGKLDYTPSIGWETHGELLETNPELQWRSDVTEIPDVIWMRVDREPLDDIRVRQALAMAIDYQLIKDEYYGGNAEILCNWILPTAEYADYFVPLDQLPESARQLYEYHPDKAKQLLAEAGYPDGFTTEVVCLSSHVDVLSIIKDYWEKIGVNLEIQVKEYGVWSAIYGRKTHDQMLIRFNTAYQPWKFAPYRPGTGTNAAFVDDKRVNEAYEAVATAEGKGDYAESARIIREIFPYIVEQAWCIQPPASYYYPTWWPWVKNFHGERSLGHYNYSLPIAYIWLDQDLKQDMGY